MDKMSSRTIKIVALAAVILIVFLAIFYFIGRKGGNIALGNPGDVAEDFIDTWHIEGYVAGKTLSERISSSADLITRDFTLSLDGRGIDEGSSTIDPATCLSSESTKVRFARQEVDKENGEATIYATQEFESAISRQVVIQMIASGGAWKVRSVDCAPASNN
jgi:hypothetical protein